MMPFRIAAGPSELRQALRRCAPGFVGIGLASAMLNLLTLAGSIYMLQVYDRVIPSHSVPTLIALTILLILIYAAFGYFDVLRSRLLAASSARFERLVRERIFIMFLSGPLRTAAGGREQPLRDLEQIRAFVGGLGPTAFFDLPWLPLYLGLIFLLHPVLGLLASIGAVVIVSLTLLTERQSREPIAVASAASARRSAFADACRRNAEAVRSLGMTATMSRRWAEESRSLALHQGRVLRVTGTLGSASKVLRMLLQSAMLGLGAYLVINNEATGGVMIASSIMTSRALAPVEIAIANWKPFVSARQSFAQLERQLAAQPARETALVLPQPSDSLEVEQLVVGPPGEGRALLQGVSFRVKAGGAVGVIGPSASGKSTLARALVGVWRPLAGAVRLDGSALDHWDADRLGSFLGYLPQDVELFDGTIAENIARFSPDASPQAVLEAAKQAGVHELVAKLPQGYGTRIGEGGCALSAGQRQRIGLARALFGDPFLVVLDEPNSNLDSDGEEALTRAISGVRDRAGIVIVVAHRPSALNAVDDILVLANGRQIAFGARDEVLRKTFRPAPAPAVAASVRGPALAIGDRG